MKTTPTRHRVLAATAALAVTLGIAACGGNSGDSGSDNATGAASFWTLEDPTNDLQQAGVDRFNDSGDGSVRMTTVPVDGYLDKLRVAMGSDNAPNLFFSWGGGPMREYAGLDKLVDIDAAPGGAEIRDQFLPSVLETGESDGKLYGVPNRGTQPVFLFYNKKVLADAGIEPPQTFDQLMSAVKTLKGEGVTPIALAGNGASSWTELMWLEYLVDRIGGPEVFQNIDAGKEGAWEDPAVKQAAQMIKQLVDAGAFGNKFGSVAYGAGGSSTLVATGRAAMQLMGSWEYATQAEASKDFAENDLGYVPFPTVEGGEGDPENIVGNPSNYVSMTTDTPERTGVGYLKSLYSKDYVKSLVELGEVPVTKNAEALLAEAPNPDYAQFQFDLVSEAPAFTQSWDQALGFKIATPMLAEIQNLFNGKSTPDEFVANLSQLS